MTRQRITDLYFEWLCERVDIDCDKEDFPYTKLMRYLFRKPFNYIMDRDANRYEDGVNMRYLFGSYKELDQEMIASYLDDAECSMLEMMAGLCMKCENIMSDPDTYGDQTGKWFWDMIRSIGFDSLDDDAFDEEEADEMVDICLYREYEPSGEGGFFTVKNAPKDLRDVEIWTQMSWYLNSICKERGII